MYIKKDFLRLKADELSDYTAKGFALCYVERCGGLTIRRKFFKSDIIKQMTHASVFSGIGGPEVAATMLGWKNLFHCEINPTLGRVGKPTLGRVVWATENRLARSPENERQIN